MDSKRHLNLKVILHNEDLGVRKCDGLNAEEKKRSVNYTACQIQRGNDAASQVSTDYILINQRMLTSIMKSKHTGRSL